MNGYISLALRQVLIASSSTKLLVIINDQSDCKAQEERCESPTDDEENHLALTRIGWYVIGHCAI